MKNKKVILIIILFGIVGIGLLLTIALRATRTSSEEPSAITKPIQPSGSIVLDTSKLPSGWKNDDEYSKYPGSVLIRNDSNGCYVQATYTTDTTESNSPDIDHYASTVDEIKGKGYGVEQTDTTLSINGANSSRQLSSIKLKETLDSKVTYQEYAFVSTQSEFVTIQLSCNSSQSLDAIKSVLNALTFTKL